jgi:hypothetical protein
MKIKSGRAVNDPEKLVTPGILYASKSDGSLSAHVIAIGWWDFHVSFLWKTGKPTPPTLSLAVRNHLERQQAPSGLSDGGEGRG